METQKEGCGNNLSLSPQHTHITARGLGTQPGQSHVIQPCNYTHALSAPDRVHTCAMFNLHGAKTCTVSTSALCLPALCPPCTVFTPALYLHPQCLHLYYVHTSTVSHLHRLHQPCVYTCTVSTPILPPHLWAVSTPALHVHLYSVYTFTMFNLHCAKTCTVSTPALCPECTAFTLHCGHPVRSILALC